MNVFSKISNLLIIFLLSQSFAFSQPANSEQPTDTSPIKIGMSAVFTGQSKDLGLQMKLGIETYFSQINKAGGIDGRKIELIALDDKYEPTLAAANMRKLILEDKVLAIIGNVGTPTAVVTIPIVNEYHTLLFAPFSGAGILRTTPPSNKEKCDAQHFI